jgi:biopolymer transport protein ExbD
VQFEAPARRRRGPGLTPLIDVVFLLLVFFMLASSFDTEATLPLSVSSETPADEAAARGDVPEELRIDVSERGQASALGRQLDRSALLLVVREHLARDRSTPIRVAPHPEAQLQAIVTVLAALEEAGARDVSVAPGSSPRPEPRVDSPRESALP